VHGAWRPLRPKRNLGRRPTDEQHAIVPDQLRFERRQPRHRLSDELLGGERVRIQSMDKHSIGAESCDCGSTTDRRRFLKEIALAATGVFIGLGSSPREAVAMPLARVIGTKAGATDWTTYPVPAVDGATIDSENQIIIARYQGSVYAFDLSCPHQRTMLKWLADDHRFQCPKHKSKYDPNGTFISGRATRNMDRHPIKLEAGKLVVDPDNIIQSDKDPAGWSSAMVKV
jgi:nitrite reductase/ring-hydroxylating ferredoxin subunit